MSYQRQFYSREKQSFSFLTNRGMVSRKDLFLNVIDFLFSSVLGSVIYSWITFTQKAPRSSTVIQDSRKGKYDIV
jgi:hypothetical protein